MLCIRFRSLMLAANLCWTCATADFRFRLDFLPPDVTVVELVVVDGPAGDIPESPSEQEEDEELGKWSGRA